MNGHKKTLEEKVASLVRLLASDKDGEIIAAARALKRTLESAGTDMNGLAHGIENLGKNAEVSKDQMKKIWDAAVQHTENRLHGGEGFRSNPGKPTPEQVALVYQRDKRRPNRNTHDFVDKMAAQTVFGREPTEKQHKYLFALFLRLGGKIQ